MFGENVRRKREAKGLSCEQLARNVDVSVRMIFYIEKGVKVPSLQLAADLAKELGCTIDDLLQPLSA